VPFLLLAEIGFKYTWNEGQRKKRKPENRFMKRRSDVTETLTGVKQNGSH
jgi:hypothetical protein